MSNYTKQNLVPVPPSQTPAGTLAIKVGDVVFTAGSISSGGGGGGGGGGEDTPTDPAKALSKESYRKAIFIWE